MKVSDSIDMALPGSGASAVSQGKGLKINRIFTRPGEDPFASVSWERRRAEIKSEKGETVFVMNDVECPTTWSQTALDIAADKYFRKAGVPLANGTTGAETSVRAMIHRVVLAIRQAGERFGGYFASPEDAQAFSDELTYMLIHQLGAFNSPVFYNCGLTEAYGIKGKPSGNFFWDPATGVVRETDDSYTHPAVSACFILSIQDDLIDIARHLEREMRVFRFGGGAGSNFSVLRAEGEPLTNGGTSSGLMSWLEIYDKGAGSTKSGGNTRRAAKLVRVDIDHPDVEKFIEWKAKEEDKALALIRAGYPKDFNGEAYRTVSGQQANNSVGVTDEFMEAVVIGGGWNTTWRTNGKIAKTYEANKLFGKIAQAAHRCACPGLQFDTTINKWHTVPKSGRIRGSNPCSEFMFLDDTSCNLASLNLVKFLANDGLNGFNTVTYKHACRVFTLAQEILVDHASYPTKVIAQNSHDFRPLGLGYANLGALLMIQGMPYDSPKGRGTAGALTAILTATGYATSAEIAASKDPFHGFVANKSEMIDVMIMHEKATGEIDLECPDGLRRDARLAWRKTVEVGIQHGYRNAQASVCAPTGTIGFMMDVDTTGVEPDFSLVKGKKLVGGGHLKIVNRSVGKALEALGYEPGSVKAILGHIEKAGTIEGAPFLRDDHEAVFDCANKSGNGKRFIEPMGHIKMLQATQPFFSGSLSKTVNCPTDTTVEEIEHLYMEAWKRGLKCIAIYRDKSKHSQPLSSGTGEKAEKPKTIDSKGRCVDAPPQTARHRLAERRPGGFTQELVVGGTKLYLRTGEYANGNLGEIFIDVNKEGATLKGVLGCFAIATSLGLQHGVPIEEFVNAFTFQKFEPAGVVRGHANVKLSTSVIDAIFRVLACEYLSREEGIEQYAQVKDGPDLGAPAPEKIASDSTPSVSMPRAAVNGNGTRVQSVIEGNVCPRCNGLLRRTGTCMSCDSCGTSTGGCG